MFSHIVEIGDANVLRGIGLLDVSGWFRKRYLQVKKFAEKSKKD